MEYKEGNPFGKGLYVIWFKDDGEVGTEYYIESVIEVVGEAFLEVIDAESFMEDHPDDWAYEYFPLESVRSLRHNGKAWNKERYGTATIPSERKTREEKEEERYAESKRNQEAFEEYYGKS